MNKQIERLVEAAPYTTISSEGRLFTQQNMAEFAKLLIRECAGVNYNSAFKEGEFCARELLEHFGVEE